MVDPSSISRLSPCLQLSTLDTALESLFYSSLANKDGEISGPTHSSRDSVLTVVAFFILQSNKGP